MQQHTPEDERRFADRRVFDDPAYVGPERRFADRRASARSRRLGLRF
jgi:hypothetical protein